jgi:putative phosphoesterase
VKVGLISDTHGLVRPDVFRALEGVSVILHAGDVGGDAVLDELQLIAPVHAVYGNTDAPDDPRLSRSVELELTGVRIHVSHGHELGSPTPDALLDRYDARVVVYGHTHRALIEERDARWCVNPGAAGARRFNLMPSVAILSIEAKSIQVELVELAL